MSFIKLLKNKPSGKLILALTLVLTFVSGLTIGSKASNHTWLSAGNVSYNNGTKTTVFDKQDLVYLDERIDSVEQDVDSYKTEIANNVNDWSIPQDKQLSSTSSFSDIADTLNYIKSTPDEGSSWVNEGNPVYKRADGSITYDASEAESGSDQLVLSAATSDNLSAGKVAWVNGDLVIGTGEDNKAYYDTGKQNSSLNITSFECTPSWKWGPGEVTVNVANYYSDYKNITVQNFIPTFSWGNVGSTGSAGGCYSRSYDNNTGVYKFYHGINTSESHFRVYIITAQ